MLRENDTQASCNIQACRGPTAGLGLMLDRCKCFSLNNVVQVSIMTPGPLLPVHCFINMHNFPQFFLSMKYLV